MTDPLHHATQISYALDWVNPLVHTTRSVKYVVSPMNKNIVFDYDENFRKVDQVAAFTTPDTVTDGSVTGGGGGGGAAATVKVSGIVWLPAAPALMVTVA